MQYNNGPKNIREHIIRSIIVRNRNRDAEIKHLQSQLTRMHRALKFASEYDEGLLECSYEGCIMFEYEKDMYSCDWCGCMYCVDHMPTGDGKKFYCKECVHFDKSCQICGTLNSIMNKCLMCCKVVCLRHYDDIYSYCSNCLSEPEIEN